MNTARAFLHELNSPGNATAIQHISDVRDKTSRLAWQLMWKAAYGMENFQVVYGQVVEICFIAVTFM
jgi:hypothetical protein